MKILHTSDWHLGQLFYGKSREQEQAAFLDWLVIQVKIHKLDAVLVAGDIFDTGTPPSYARALYNQFIVQLHHECPDCQLILLAGNHDSVAVLNESKGLLKALNTQVIAGADPDALEQSADHLTGDLVKELLIPLTDSTRKPAAVLCAIPFLRPSDLMRSRSDQSAEERQRQLTQQIQGYYHQLFELAKQVYPNLPVVMTGHLTTVGASTSESVKDIYIGTLDAFPASAFPPADYIALGHIHRPQKVAKSEHIRYCGSPVALSFDEIGRRKEVLIVELEPEKGFVAAESLTVPVFQPLIRLNGCLSDIETHLSDLSPETDKLEPGQTLWAEINVQTDDYLADLQPRIEALIGDQPVEVLRIRRDNRARSTLADHQPLVQLDELTPEEVFLKRLSQETLEEARRNALIDCFQQIRTELQEEESL